MRIATHLGVPTESLLRLAAQAGVSDIVASPPPSQPGQPARFEDWVRMRKQVEDAGLKLSVIESLPLSDKVMVGLPGRDEEIERYMQSIRYMGAAGIEVHCYNWMPAIHVVRTSHTTRVRGGALATSYEHKLMEKAPETYLGRVHAEQLWDALAYFLRAVLPVAEEAGLVLGMHPDDPPVSPIRGLDRLMVSPEAFQRLLDLVPSPSNAITFCQGCFSEMNADIPATIRRFGGQGKIAFAHFRNVSGVATDFHETFHDDGDTDMFAAMQAYYEVGFNGPMRPDHFPLMEGEPAGEGGRVILGRLYAIGYMRGLIHGVERTSKGR
ncbi:MAG: TIM barrel protein [Chloroflexi bacterium]|nr:TIM barrel protein [Chloroflexota bacterium]